MEINWTVVTYIVIGLFALNGFFRGWWKEAVTLGFLILLVFLLQQPGIAQAVINIINNFLSWIWGNLPESFTTFLTNIFENVFGINTAGGPIQADAAQPATWLLFLVIGLALIALITRITLPDYGNRPGYAVTPIGGVLGGLVGALNGFVVIELVRAYLERRSLPGEPATEIVAQSVGGRPVGIAAAGPTLQATQAPSFTLLDSFLPWVIIALGIIIFLIALRNRVRLRTSEGGFRRIEYIPPYGYRRYG